MGNGGSKLSCNYGHSKSRLLVWGKGLEMGVTAVIHFMSVSVIVVIFMITINGMMHCQDVTGCRMFTGRLSMPRMESTGKQAYQQQYGSNSQHHGVVSLLVFFVC